jgi:hypothetical protein
MGESPPWPLATKPLMPPPDGPPLAAVTEQVLSNVFVSRVTAAFRAKALPHEIVALVFMVRLVSATIFPSNAVEVPSVAELPTCQNRPSLEPSLMMLTSEALAVVSVLPIRNTAGSPSPELAGQTCQIYRRLT